MANSGTDTSPHDFKPLRFWDRFHQRGRCRACLLPKYGHPVRCWMTARPIGHTRYYDWSSVVAHKLARDGNKHISKGEER